jgi:hypothetical protein
MADEPAPQPVVVTNPGVITVATGAIDALRGSPTLLVMVLLNCMMIVAAAYYLRNQQDQAFKSINMIFDHCLPDRTPDHPPFKTTP